MRLCYGCYVNFHCGTAADRAGTGAARTPLGELHPNGEEQRYWYQTNLAATFTLNAHEFHAIEGPFFPSFEYDDVLIHCLNSPLMRPDFGNSAIHTDERCGYSGEDPYAVSDFKVTHNNRSPSFSKTGEWQAWERGNWV